MRIRRHLQSLPILSCRETIAIYKRALIELMADARLDMCGIVCDSSWHDPVACAFPPEHDGPHSWASIPALQPATLGLPPDLVRVLRDPTITIDRDHEIRLADGRRNGQRRDEIPF